MSQLILTNVEGHIINVGDISTVSPSSSYVSSPGNLATETKGVKITFMSKATSIFIPGLTAEEFMEKLVTKSVRLSDRD